MPLSGATSIKMSAVLISNQSEIYKFSFFCLGFKGVMFRANKITKRIVVDFIRAFVIVTNMNYFFIVSSGVVNGMKNRFQISLVFILRIVHT